jgi:CheY-like chemotaxis protein
MMSKIHILVVEDNPGDVLLIQQALDEYGVAYDMHVIHDGAEAVSYLADIGRTGKRCPDLFLLDLNLPKMDGSEVLTAIRKNDDCAATPVIVISSSDTERDRARIEGLNVSRYFKKPFDLSGFMRLGGLVREVVQEH